MILCTATDADTDGLRAQFLRLPLRLSPSLELTDELLDDLAWCASLQVQGTHVVVESSASKYALKRTIASATRNWSS